MSGPCRTFHYRTKKRAACHDKSTGLYAVQAHPGGYREGQVWGNSAQNAGRHEARFESRADLRTGYQAYDLYH